MSAAATSEPFANFWAERAAQQQALEQAVVGQVEDISAKAAVQIALRVTKVVEGLKQPMASLPTKSAPLKLSYEWSYTSASPVFDEAMKTHSDLMSELHGLQVSDECSYSVDHAAFSQAIAPILNETMTKVATLLAEYDEHPGIFWSVEAVQNSPLSSESQLANRVTVTVWTENPSQKKSWW